MENRILVTVPNLKTPGGVSAFWNALLPEFAKIKGIALSTLEIGGHGKNIFGPLKDQFRFQKEAKRKHNLVLLNPSLGGKSFFRDALFARYMVKKEIPFVLFFHGWDSDFEKRIDEKYVKFFLNTLGKAKKIFVLSSRFKQKLLEWGYTGEVLLATTTINADLQSQLFTKTLPTNDMPLKILFLSRLLKQKGIYETIDAFRNVKKTITNVELVIAGDGEEFEHVQKYVAGDSHIRLVGHVVGADKTELYKTSTLYCLPSYSEGLPTTVLEAMAFGLPVLTTPVGGLPDFFQNGKMGYLVSVENVEELTEKMHFLLTQHDKRIEIGQYNYKYAHEHIVSAKVATFIYDQVVNLM